MVLSAKNFTLFVLMVLLVVVFGLHWFFVDKTMPISECLSINCVYSSPQAMPQEFKNFLPSVIWIALLALFATAIARLLLPENAPKERSGKFSVFKKKDDTFRYKFNSWLKILEKRDPQTALVVARISDFRQ